MAITNLYLRAMEIQKNNKSIIKYNFQIVGGGNFCFEKNRKKYC